MEGLSLLPWVRYSDYFRSKRLKKGITTAVKRGYDLPVLRWWLYCYMPDQTAYGLEFVLELAIDEAQLPMLEWIHQVTQGRLPALTQPAHCSNAKAIYWLYDHGGRHVPVKLWLHSLQTDARCSFIKWCMERGGDCKRYFGFPRDALKSAAEHSLELLRQLLEFWPELCAPDSVNTAMEKGQFESIKWLYESRPTHYFSDVYVYSMTFIGNPEAVRWIVFVVEWRDQAARLAWIDSAIHIAVCTDKIDLCYSFTNLRQQIITNKPTEDQLLGMNQTEEALR